MSSAIITADMLARLEKLQKGLDTLIEMRRVEASKPSKPSKTSKPKDPDAPKKEPNVWIKFTLRVGPLISAALKEAKAPATVSKQFCSFLKEKKAYDLWTDDEILEAYGSWERPTVSKMELDKAKKSSSAEGSEASETEKTEKKVRKPQSEETKAAAAVKRAANRAKKLAEAKASASESESEAEETEVPAPKPEVKKAEVKVEKAEAKVEPKVEKAEPKAEKAKKEKKEYTMEQLTDFDSFTHEGTDYGRNVRGDVVNGDGAFVGHWTGKAVKKTAAPADWAEVQKAMA